MGNIFDQLKGIKAPREIAESGTVLHSLVKLYEQLLGSYLGDSRFDENIIPIHNEMFDIAKNEIKVFSEADLVSLVRACDAPEMEREYSILTGMYCGILLHLLTERNREQGKGTTFYMDGNGFTSSRMFFLAKDVDELILENFSGDYLANNVGTFGSANMVVFINCTGDYLGSEMGSMGRVGTVIAAGCKSKYQLMGVAGRKGIASCVALLDSEADTALWAAEGGEMDEVVIAGCKGENLPYYLGTHGRIGRITMYDNTIKNQLLRGPSNWGPYIQNREEADKLCSEDPKYAALITEIEKIRNGTTAEIIESARRLARMYPIHQKQEGAENGR